MMCALVVSVDCIGLRYASGLTLTSQFVQKRRAGRLVIESVSRAIS
jgi:hypothetical protein